MFNLSIIYEDADLLVIDKQADLVVTRAQSVKQTTLQDLLCDYIKPGAIVSSDFYKRCGIVHRLDKKTSGVLVVAKTEAAFEDLQRQFKERVVKKEYVALVHGILQDDSIEINAPLQRNPNNRFKFAVVRGGREAITKVTRWHVFDDYTLVHVFPKTGRTHQIRVHLAALGHPVIGDDLYSSKHLLKKWGSVFGRLMLHAHKLSFKHPVKNEVVTFEAPIPPEFPA